MFKSILLASFIAANLINQAFAWNSQPTEVTFQNTDGLTLQGRLFVPDNSSAALPAVIMLHGCKGVYNADGEIKTLYREWADRLTAAGYVALLVDSFTPRGVGVQCSNGAGVGVSEIFDRPKDVVAARNYLASLPQTVNAAKIGVLGWSHGASTVVSALATTQPTDTNSANPNAAGAPIKVGIAFYAGCGLADSQCGSQNNGNPASCWGGLSQSKWDSYAPLHFFHGNADTTTKLEYCNTRISRATLSTGGSVLSLTAYDQAVHSFDEPDVGGGVCVNSATTPNQCAKQHADAAALSALNQYLK